MKNHLCRLGNLEDNGTYEGNSRVRVIFIKCDLFCLSVFVSCSLCRYHRLPSFPLMHVAMHVLVDMNKRQEEVAAEKYDNNMEQITFL